MNQREKILVYLDNCMFNRPFDDQNNIRIRLETEAKLHVQDMIVQGELSLVWSYILDYENSKNPFFDRRFAIEQWQFLAKYTIMQTESIIKYAKQLQAIGIKNKDALHVACAVEAGANYFLSTDDKLLNKLIGSRDIQALNPTLFIQVITNDY